MRITASTRFALRRAFIAAFAIAIIVAMGVRTKKTQASPWSKASFKGPARAALAIDEIQMGDAEFLGANLDVFAAATYATETSRFDTGVLIQTRFSLPHTGHTGVLTLDLDRRGARDTWLGGADHVLARYYVIDPSTDETRFDGAALAGELKLERLVVAREAIGFRIRGWVELVDPGPDGDFVTADDRVVEIEVAIETTPPPEQLTADPSDPSPLPTVGLCEPPNCYDDPGYYYDDYVVDASCTGGDYDDELDDGGGGGCEGDTYDDDYDFVDSGGGDDAYYDDSGCDSSDSEGCESGDYDYGDSAGDSGCDSDSDLSGCDGGSSSSGCGSGGGGCGGGCSGDVL